MQPAQSMPFASLLTALLCFGVAQAQTAQVPQAVQTPKAAWYRAAYCDPLLGGCTIHDCAVSDISPAQIYENNQAYGGAQIIDGGDEVDVIAQGARTIFFRTITGCKTFTAAQTQAAKKQEQDRQQKLDPYR